MPVAVLFAYFFLIFSLSFICFLLSLHFSLSLFTFSFLFFCLSLFSCLLVLILYIPVSHRLFFLHVPLPASVPFPYFPLFLCYSLCFPSYLSFVSQMSYVFFFMPVSSCFLQSPFLFMFSFFLPLDYFFVFLSYELSSNVMFLK
jgi:hypothetical protein